MNALTNTAHKEGKVAKAIEEQTAKLPSDVFLWAALGSMGISLALKFMAKNTDGHKHEHNSLFIGQWAAPLLLLGVYNKLVKLQGSE